MRGLGDQKKHCYCVCRGTAPAAASRHAGFFQQDAGGVPSSRPALCQGPAHLVDVARERDFLDRTARRLHLRPHVRRLHPRDFQPSRCAQARGVLHLPLLLRQDLPRHAAFSGASSTVIVLHCILVFFGFLFECAP